MKIKRICRLCVDIAMLAVTVLLMALNRTGIMLHILLGIVLLVLVIIHNALNISWWASIGQGRCNQFRWMQTIINLSFLFNIFIILISGMAYAVTLHRLASLLYLMMMFVHLGLHWKRCSHSIKN